MLKYTTSQVTFREIPDEITLCINISNCPIKCPDCHSKELWQDIGEDLTIEKIIALIEKNKGITTICFMGGDSDYPSLQRLISDIIYYNITNHTDIKTAIYSGRNNLDELYKLAGHWIDAIEYIKVGPYVKELGGLDSPNTNQKLYHWGENITFKFWKNDTNIS